MQAFIFQQSGQYCGATLLKGIGYLNESVEANNCIKKFN